MSTSSFRPTVVIVNDRAYAAGGASKVAIASAIGLARRGWTVKLFAAMGPPATELLDAGVDVIVSDQPDIASAVNKFSVAAQAIWNTSAASTLRQLISTLPRAATVVHVHSWSKALSPSVFAVSRSFSLPTFATLHDYGFVCPNAALHDYPSGKACTLKPMSIPCIGRQCDARKYVHKLWRVGRQVSLDWFAHPADTLTAAICVSEYSRSVYEQYLPAQLKTCVVENPIDAPMQAPAQPASNSTFLYAGRLSREKGVIVLAEAARKAHVPLKIVGDGELASAVREINPEVTITGWQTRAAVLEEMRSARALVVPSLWRETHGMVVPEAMAAGIPCIVSSRTAPAATITDGINGRIFTNGNSDDLAALLRELALEDRAISDMGQRAYEHYWSKPLTLNAHVDALERLYLSTVHS